MARLAPAANSTRMMLTRVIPHPMNDDGTQEFADDVRSAGCAGEPIVGDGLSSRAFD